MNCSQATPRGRENTAGSSALGCFHLQPQQLENRWLLSTAREVQCWDVGDLHQVPLPECVMDCAGSANSIRGCGTRWSRFQVSTMRPRVLPCKIGSSRYLRQRPPALVTSKRRKLSLLQRAPRSVDLASSWTAGMTRDGSEKSIEKLIAVGRKATGDEGSSRRGIGILGCFAGARSTAFSTKASVHCHRSCRRHPSFFTSPSNSMSIPSEVYSDRHCSNSHHAFQTAKMEPFSIPLVPQSGGLCFEVTVGDMFDE